MKQLFAYIRVSDPKQGKGVSLTEQRSIIEAYAVRIDAVIVEWFVETRTAAKAGRPVWNRMVKLVRARKAQGFILHKLDRGTRNFFDWAAINEFLDSGVDVHVAHDSLDLRSRGGRLAADMQVVIAVDYIRNLREEALKGIHGRLKQGILPNAAGTGYLNRGGGNPKEVDPVMGPLVRRVFELYATGAYTLRDLTVESEKIGLRNRVARPLSKQQLHNVLRNPFYMGVIRSERYGLFPGKHVPLVTKYVFERVQAVLAGKYVRRTKRFTFLFRRFIRCETCGRSLVGSERKGHVYYRCATIGCPTTSLREDAIESAVRAELRRIEFPPEAITLLKQELAKQFADEASVRTAHRNALAETLRATNARIERLTDLLLDGKIDPVAHDEKRATLVLERQGLLQDIAAQDSGDVDLRGRTDRIVELLESPVFLYESAVPAKRRQLLEIVMSNCSATGKSLRFSRHEPFATFARFDAVNNGGQFYDTGRTFSAETLIKWASACPQALADALESIGPESELGFLALAA
jgi:site-specific DNA recombinase